MKEVLTDVLKAENDAEQSIREAREKRDMMKSRGEAEISEMIKAAKVRAQQSLRESIQKTRTDATTKQEETIRRAAEEAEQFASKEEETIKSIVNEVVDLIVASDLPG